MSRPPDATTAPGALQALAAAIDQNHELKAKVEAVADELASSNQLAETQIAEGTTMLPALQVLKDGMAVERQVQEVACELQQVNVSLSQGLGEVLQVEQALDRSRQALHDSKAELASSIDAERAASWRAMHDGRTGLPNRSLFDDWVIEVMRRVMQ